MKLHARRAGQAVAQYLHERSYFAEGRPRFYERSEPDGQTEDRSPVLAAVHSGSVEKSVGGLNYGCEWAVTRGAVWIEKAKECRQRAG